MPYFTGINGEVGLSISLRLEKNVHAVATRHHWTLRNVVLHLFELSPKTLEESNC